jgi:predicted dehydrogenase
MKKIKIPEQDLTRRKFIGTTAAAVTGFSLIPRHVLGGPKFVAPSDKVNIALVGCGSQGLSNARALFQFSDAQFIAVADPVELHSTKIISGVPDTGWRPMKAEMEKNYAARNPNYKVSAYEDFREMLEKESAIDAVLCATPDHLHAYVSILAMRQGKHVYCEKPLTHNVWEARQVAKVAKETGVATQMGNQGHSGDYIRHTCELIWAGAIGEVREVHAWTGATRYNKHHIAGKPPAEPVPKGVNWDLWLGPRAERPFSSLYERITWRDFWDFGTGPIGDFFCHNFDPAFWALDLREPLNIEGSAAGKVDSYIAPVGAYYTYHFGPRGKMPAVKFHWYDGGLRPARPDSLDADDQLGSGENGTLFVGEKGMLTCAGWAGRPMLLPGSKFEDYKQPDPTLPRSKGHHRDWLDACKGGPAASANFEYGAALTEVGLLGMVALRLGQKIYWDAANMKVKNVPAAEPLLNEPRRAGWEIT